MLDVDDHTYDPSPVPSDADLWPGELPFTAWGERDADTLDLRVFDQGTWGMGRLQVPHGLAEMSLEYIANAITFLEENADHHYRDRVWRPFVQWHGDQLFGRVPLDAVARMAGAPSMADQPPKAWLEGTPLMRALHRRHSDG